MKTIRLLAAFTLVELMVATSIIALLSLLLGSMTHRASDTWRQNSAKVAQFQEARRGFESMTRRISQATLNPHWDYLYAPDDPDHLRAPIAYTRQARLRFRSGPMAKLAAGASAVHPTHGIFFQAPLGLVENPKYESMENLLNTWGYFLEVGDDRDSIPDFLLRYVKVRVRSRLMALREPTERLAVYQMPLGISDDRWFSEALDRKPRPVRILAENIVGLVILPRLSSEDEEARAREKRPSLSPTFEYDSTLTSNHQPPLNPPDPEINPKNQVPPVVMITMVAIDEPSAERLEQMSKGSPTLGLQTTDLFKRADRLADDPATEEVGDGDISKLEQQLQTKKLRYRTFTTSVGVRAAKWSRSQRN
jgi:uncharacterized protein (TIGR02599 family)